MSGGVPAGSVLVPVEPTPSMMANAAIALGRSGALHGEERQKLLDFWSAMLSAVPTPTPPIEGRDADVERVIETVLYRSSLNGTTAQIDETAREIFAALQALGERG